MSLMSSIFGTEDLEYAMNRPLVSADRGRGFGTYSQQFGLPNNAAYSLYGCTLKKIHFTFNYLTCLELTKLNKL